MPRWSRWNLLSKHLWWEIFEDASSTHPLAKVDDILISTTILVSVCILVIGSNSTWREQWEGYLITLNFVCDFVFVLEYMLRAWSAGSLPKYRGWKRISFLIKPVMILDLICIIPVFAPLFFSTNPEFVRVFRFARLLRLIKLARYSKSMRVILNVILNSWNEIITSTCLAGIIMLLLSALLWLFENPAQPEVFPDILTSLWTAGVTLTTIGYGDSYPITFGGRIITLFIALFGGGYVIGLPTAIVIDAFSKAKQKPTSMIITCPHCGESHRVDIQ